MSSRTLRFLVGLTVSLVLLGCSDQRRTLYFTRATSACGAATPPLDIACMLVRVCESDHPDVCLAIAPPSGDHPESSAGNRPLLVDGNVVPFDVPAAAGTLYDVDVQVFGPSGASPASLIAVGHATRISFDDPGNRVFLYPGDGSYTCLPFASDLPLRRAFHQSVALSNGDALIVGGVTTPGAIRINFGTPTVGLVPTSDAVLAFDAHDEQFHRVELRGAPEDVAQVARTFFEARWIARSVDGLERVRLFGGVTGAGQLTFEQGPMSEMPTHVLAGTGTPAAVIDLLYDPRSHSASVERVSARLVVGLESARDALPGSPVRALEGFVGDGREVAWSVEELVGASGPVFASMGKRRGATLTRLLESTFLVYGGQRQALVAGDPAGYDWDQTLDRAMVIDGGARLTSAPPDALAVSTLHTASAIGADRVVFVGGLGLVDSLTAAPTSPAVRAFRYAPSARALERLEIQGADGVDRERIYHTATLYRAPSATLDSVVVIGGSTGIRDATPQAQLQPMDDSFVVEMDAPARIRPLASLHTARFGHASALLRGGRILVTGGLRRGVPANHEESTDLYVVDAPELVSVRPPAAPILCESGAIDSGVARDAGVDGGSGGGADAGESLDAAPVELDASGG